MTLARRGRSIAVIGFVLAGTIGLISSTQTWLTVDVVGSTEPIVVAGAVALPLLAPLSLAVLAIGAALSISRTVVRFVLGVLGALAAGVLIAITLAILTGLSTSSYASAVTEATGLAGDKAMSELVQSVSVSAWPVLAIVGWAILVSAVAVVLFTGRQWKSGGRRYSTESVDAQNTVKTEGPVDSVDSWDELSRGTDPTS